MASLEGKGNRVNGLMSVGTAGKTPLLLNS